MFFLKSLQEWPVRKDFVFKNQFHKIHYNIAWLFFIFNFLIFFPCKRTTDRIKNKISLADLNDIKNSTAFYKSTYRY